MLNNVAIDVFIGLIFVFLIYSLLATILQEIVARMLNLRGKNLLKAIRVMLEDRESHGGNYFTRLFNHISSNIKHFTCPFPKESLAKAFYTHPTIKYLSESSFRSKPSYMGSYNFSTTMIKLLRGKEFNGTTDEMEAIRKILFEKNEVISGSLSNTVKATIDPETLEQLQQLYIDSDKKIDNFKLLLERWFDETMDRASGWYKKQTQLVLFIIGLTIAIVFNGDTIAIYNILSKDKQAREQFVNLAINANSKYDSLNQQLIKVSVKDSSLAITTDSLGKVDSSWTYKTSDKILLSDTSLNEAKKMLIADIKDANNILGLGRDWDDSCSTCKKMTSTLENSNIPSKEKQRLLDILSKSKNKDCTDKTCVNSRTWLQWHPMQRGGIVTIVGWIVMALGISLGAPFWFDMLNKIMQIRGSGAKPKEVAKEPETK